MKNRIIPFFTFGYSQIEAQEDEEPFNNYVLITFHMGVPNKSSPEGRQWAEINGYRLSRIRIEHEKRLFLQIEGHYL